MTEHGNGERLPERAAEDDRVLAAMLAQIEAGTLAVTDAASGQLIGALSHPRKHVRRSAAGALAAALRRGVIRQETCEALLDHGDENARWGAAYALHSAGRSGTGVVDVAVASLHGADADVRWAAAAIVIASARTSLPLRARLRLLATSPSATARKMALMCLSGSGESDPSIYVTSLGDEDELVRVAALTSLGRVGAVSTSVLEAVGAVAEGDAKATVRRAAAAVLRRLRSSHPASTRDAE